MISLRYQYVLAASTMMFVAIDAQAVLIGHWKFDEMGGRNPALTAVDSVNGNNADYVPHPDPTNPGYDAAPGWQPGLIGGAVGLSDEDSAGAPAEPIHQEYFVIPSIPQMVGAQQLSISIWFNQNDPSGPNLNDGNSGLIRTRNLESTKATGRTAGMNTEGTNSGDDGHVDARMASGNGQADSSPEFSNDPGWHHALMVWDASDDSGGADTGLTKIYFDGVLAGSGSHDQLASTITASGEWWIGGVDCCGNSDGEFKRGFTGALDDLAMWDEALTADEVSHVYYGGLQGLDAPTARAAMVPEPTSLCLLSLLIGGVWAARRWPQAL